MAMELQIDNSTIHGTRKPRFGRRGNSYMDYGAPAVVNMRNPRATSNDAKELKQPVKIGTWNVRTMYQSAKIHNLKQEMKYLDIRGISETRWPGTRQFDMEGYKIFYSGTSNNKHEYGVAIIINPRIAKYMNNFSPISEGVILRQLNSAPVNINIIQVYAPTTEERDESVEEFYDSLTTVTSQFKQKDMNIIMGDFNAKMAEADKEI